jgi:hypothetical protein
MILGVCHQRRSRHPRTSSSHLCRHCERIECGRDHRGLRCRECTVSLWLRTKESSRLVESGCIIHRDVWFSTWNLSLIEECFVRGCRCACRRRNIQGLVDSAHHLFNSSILTLLYCLMISYLLLIKPLLDLMRWFNLIDPHFLTITLQS